MLVEGSTNIQIIVVGKLETLLWKLHTTTFDCKENSIPMLKMWQVLG